MEEVTQLQKQSGLKSGIVKAVYVTGVSKIVPEILGGGFCYFSMLLFSENFFSKLPLNPGIDLDQPSRDSLWY